MSSSRFDLFVTCKLKLKPIWSCCCSTCGCIDTTAQLFLNTFLHVLRVWADQQRLWWNLPSLKSQRFVWRNTACISELRHKEHVFSFTPGHQRDLCHLCQSRGHGSLQTQVGCHQLFRWQNKVNRLLHFYWVSKLWLSSGLLTLSFTRVWENKQMLLSRKLENSDLILEREADYFFSSSICNCWSWTSSVNQYF